MATDNKINGEEHKDNGEAPRQRRRRTPEETLEAEKKKLLKQREKVKKAERVVRLNKRQKEQIAKVERRSNDRASDGILGGMFKHLVRKGDPEARAMYARLRRDFPADREQVVFQFDEVVGYAEWGPAAEKVRSRKPVTAQGHSSFPQP